MLSLIWQPPSELSKAFFFFFEPERGWGVCINPDIPHQALAGRGYRALRSFHSSQDQKCQGHIAGAEHQSRPLPKSHVLMRKPEGWQNSGAISLPLISTHLSWGTNREMLDVTINESGHTLSVLKHIFHGNLHELAPCFQNLLKNLASIHFNELTHPE